MRKVKFTQENFDERLKGILDEFPKLDVSLATSLSTKHNCDRDCLCFKQL